ncbi:MAG: DUF2723 domain-containing protein [Deltaproteobacteria bacterium]|nr:DUF2723 domain-containing protein [Deltaproteobacteria bacterium]
MTSRAFALGAVPAALWFTLHAAPSVAYRDAGELTAASFLLDVPHPTGFPVDMVLVRLVMLIPIGDLAFRANLAVGALMALACGCASVLAFRLVPSFPSLTRLALSFVTAAALMASSTVLRAATVMEVYAGSLLVTLAALTLTGGRAPLATRRRLSGLSLGLALATHATARPAAILVTGLTSWPALRGARGSARARVLAAVGALAVVGALVVLYLPLSSLRDGPIDWGDPQTLGRLRDHLSARAIREAYLHRILVPWRFTEDLATAARTLVEDLGAPFVLLAVAGMLVAARRRAAWPVLAATLVDLVYAVTVNPMGTPDRQTLFVTEAGMAVLGVLALGALIERLAGRVRWEVSLAVVFAIAVGTLARYDRRWAGSADRWAATEVLGGAGALGSLPARAVVLCNSDDTCGGAMFAQWVEGERPDVTVLPPRFLGDASTWRRLTAHRSLLRRPQAAPARGSIDEWRLRWLIAHARDRVRWEGDGIDVPWLTLSPGETPLLARVGAAEAADAAVDRDASRWVLPRVPGDGVGARYVGAMVLFSAGVREARGDLSRGAPLWRAALTVSPEHAGAWRNLAVIEARSGHLAEAVAMTRRSLDLQPDRPRAWRNLAEYLAASGDRAGAAEARREAARR